MTTASEREAERALDQDYEDVVIAKVTKGRDDDGYTIEMGGHRHGLTGWFKWPLDVNQPRKGDEMRVYTTALFGHEHYGHALWRDGVLIPVEYKTKAEREAARKAWLEKHERDRFERNAESLEKYADLSFLPLPLQRRIERFRAKGGNHYSEPYEMAPVLEAARLLKRCNDPAFGAELKERGIKAPTEEALALRSWEQDETHGRLDWPDTPEWRLIAFDSINSKMNGYQYDLMKEIMPEMDDGHSGNTWGAAISFTRLLITDGDDAKL